MNENTTPVKSIDIPLYFKLDLLRGKESEMISQNKDGLAVFSDKILQKAKVYVIVHNGKFHCDEVMAIALLMLYFNNVVVIRTRSEADIKKGDLVIDLAEGTFDHHGALDDGISAACSKVYRIMIQTPETYGLYVPEVWKEIGDFVEEAAAQDTGRSNTINFAWIQTFAAAYLCNHDENLFDKAVEMMAFQLRALIVSAQARVTGSVNFEKLMEDHPNDDLLIVPKDCTGAKVKVRLWETKHPSLFYIIEGEDQFMVIATQDPEKEYTGFNSKKLMPERFRGLKDGAFRKATGFNDGVFCHAKGFIAGFRSLASAVEFAKLCINE